MVTDLVIVNPENPNFRKGFRSRAEITDPGCDKGGRQRLRQRWAGKLSNSILGEQVFQVGLGEAAGEAFFAEDVGDGLGFALLQFPDLFFDSSRGDQTVGVDRSSL